MIRLSDYLVKRLESHGVRDVFLITGGGAMHLNDAFGKAKKIKYYCNQHEQACAIAAEGYARASGKLAVVNVTSGPGGTNTLTGVIGQWLDSVPVLYISGQVKFETTIASCPKIGLRQLGDQEINIVDIVKPVTKYAVMVKDPNTIKYHLEKAIYLATHGRPGPVWLDIPTNVQAAPIDITDLKEYDPKTDEIIFNSKKIDAQIQKALLLIKKSERPVILAGGGVRISGAKNQFIELLNLLKIPAVVTINGLDLVPTDHPLNIGKIGSFGDRPGNFCLQNSDLLISIGSRNNVRQVSFNWKAFARDAKIISVDIDPKELKKPTLTIDLPINSDAKYFIDGLLKLAKKTSLPEHKDWVNWCQERREKYPIVLPKYKTLEKVSPYYFLRTLTENLHKDSVVVAANGSAFVIGYQSYFVKSDQRYIWNSGCASMGYDLPAAIGACIAMGKKEIICVAGDGSMQMNLQELQTIQNYKLPIKIIYLNNEGYISIKQTQDAFFEKRVGCCQKSGVVLPEIKKIAIAYGLPYFAITNNNNLKTKIKNVLAKKGSLICEVFLPGDHRFEPKLSSQKRADGTMVSKPLEDMFPFLEREEVRENMIIEEWKC